MQLFSSQQSVHQAYQHKSGETTPNRGHIQSLQLPGHGSMADDRGSTPTRQWKIMTRKNVSKLFTFQIELSEFVT